MMKYTGMMLFPARMKYAIKELASYYINHIHISILNCKKCMGVKSHKLDTTGTQMYTAESATSVFRSAVSCGSTLVFR